MLQISIRYSSLSFHPISAQRYEDIDYHGGIQALTFLGNRPSLKTNGTLKFNMRVIGNIL